MSTIVYVKVRQNHLYKFYDWKFCSGVFKLDNIGTYTVSINKFLNPDKLKIPILLESSIGTENNVGKNIIAIFEWIHTNTSEGYIGKISLITQ